ncbi:MAG: replication-associated recombination protein A [Bdellovibrionales bacterium]|nr:replication-associated recombination protein A [Bdellovibrionales bacterium]
MELFTHASQNHKSDNAPLAHRLRPSSLEDFIGQGQVLGENSPLKKMILKGIVPNLILWGPPGVGKTTFAELLSKYIKADFLSLNAVATGAKEIREIGERAKEKRAMYQTQTLVFIDEVHRLNRAQQDVLLPYIEKGVFTFLGATTENPSFQLTSALLSRSRLVVFERHNTESLRKILDRAFLIMQKNKADILTQDAEDYLLQIADGDARTLINSIEYIENYLRADENILLPFDHIKLKDFLSKDSFVYDRNDSHYDTISAFIKSIRGSDADAAIYYLARMLKGGEDPLFIARRLVILASEDVGNADPKALGIATAGMQAVEFVGLPECAINLAQVVTYLATAPKSNRSYLSLKKAQAEVEASGNLKIPTGIRNAPTQLMKNLGYGKDYLYSHDHPKGYAKQQFLPTEIKDLVFYEPVDRGYEKHINEFIKWLKS